MVRIATFSLALTACAAASPAPPAATPASLAVQPSAVAAPPEAAELREQMRTAEARAVADGQALVAAGEAEKVRRTMAAEAKACEAGATRRANIRRAWALYEETRAPYLAWVAKHCTEVDHPPALVVATRQTSATTAQSTITRSRGSTEMRCPTPPPAIYARSQVAEPASPLPDDCRDYDARQTPPAP